MSFGRSTSAKPALRHVANRYGARQQRRTTFLRTTGVLDFLYENSKSGAEITLRLGVAFCLRQFHGLITELVRGAWVRYIRQQNLAALGDAADLHEFLFGSERANLSVVRGVLREVQEDECFYCGRDLRDTSDVDHFIPWVTYPVDLGHNFVLAHRKCNGAKSGRLASEEHLSAWVERNVNHGIRMGAEFDRLGVAHSLDASVRIARWAYSRTASAGGSTWQEGNVLVPLPPEWERAFTRLASASCPTVPSAPFR